MSLSAPGPGDYFTGENLDFVFVFSEPVDVEGTPFVTVDLGTGWRSATYASGSGTTTLLFRYTIVEDDYDVDGLDMSGIMLAGGSIAAASGIDAALCFVPPDLRHVLVNSFLHCPDGYVLIPGAAVAGTGDFCIARYEMSELHGMPVSGPGTAPIGHLTPQSADELCTRLGADYHLVSNLQWQSVAWNIESVADNWEGYSRGQGRMVVGNYSIESGAALADDARACETPGFAVRFPGCFDHSTDAFLRRRTHVLPTGSVIWDIGGNHGEWVLGAAPDARRDFACGLRGDDKARFGPAGDYSADCPADGTPVSNFAHGHAFGYLEGSGGSNIFRGGSAGMEGSPWDPCPGIFYANTNSFWDAPPSDNGNAFRCVYAPTVPGNARPALYPANVTVATGRTQTFVAHGGASPQLVSFMSNQSGATFDAATGTYVAGGSTGVTDVLQLADGHGGVVTASVRVVARP